jgi:hypothetical protein
MKRINKLSKSPKLIIFDTNAHSRKLMKGKFDFWKGGRLGKYIWGAELLIFPTHIDDAHWFVIAVDMKKKSVQIYDSFTAYSDVETHTTPVLKWLDDHPEKPEDFDKSQWTKDKLNSYPQQTDPDCGVFAMQCMLYLSHSEHTPVSFPYTHDDMQRLRAEIGYQLLAGELFEFVEPSSIVDLTADDSADDESLWDQTWGSKMD